MKLNWTKIVGYGLLCFTTPMFSLCAMREAWQGAANMMIFSFVILLGLSMSENNSRK